MRGKSIILGSVFLLCVTIDYAEFYTTVKIYCTLPDGHTSTCKPVQECKSIVELINSTNPFTRRAQRKLAHYSCQNNIKEQTTHVCCPSGHVTIPDEIPPPPDVSNHKNLNLLPEDCGVIEIEDKIRNGQDASLTEFPWMALLSYNTPNGPNFKCGATIINERYILTAAHCVTGIEEPLLGVRVGEYNLALKTDCEDEYCLPPVQDLAIETILYPEDYNATLYANDIALLRVTKINLDSGNAKPICLPINDQLRNINVTKAVVTGWGFIDQHNKIKTNILQKVLLERRDKSICKRFYGIQPSLKVSFKQLCVGGKDKKDSCRGDSGGPLQVPLHVDGEGRYVQYGIVSAGPSNCGWVDAPGLYTNIVYYMDWILDSLEP